MARSSTPGKKGCHATWKLDLRRQTTDNGTTTRLPPPLPHLTPVLYKVYTKGLADLNSNALSRVLTLAEDRLIYKTASGTHTSVTAVQEQLEKNVTMAPRDRVRNQCKQWANPVVHLQQQSSRTGNASALLQLRSHRMHELSQTPRDPLRQSAAVHDAGQFNKTQVQERTARAESHRCKRYRTSSVPAVSECDTQHQKLWSGSHNHVTVQPAET